MKHFTLPKDGGLIETGLPLGILHSYEKISAEIRTDMDTASEEIAGIIIKAINDFGRTEPGRAFKLGLSTGMSPVALYQILSRRNKEGDVSFKNVEIFSIDEYYPVGTNGAKGRNRKLYTELLDNIDIPAANIHIPDASVPQTDIGAYCAEFDKAARNLDLLVIGVGQQGQVGFNEAGASELSRTRTVQLSYKTRKIQARNFNGALEDTPRMAVTMGISTMMSAKKVILMAFGESKVNTVKAIVEGEMDPAYPASWFQKHEDVTMYVDETASSLLTRVDAPWLIGPCEWTRKFRRKAVVWLCQKVGKPILKLSQKDYLENSLGELIELYGPYDKINIDIFNDLQHTITGWPGGKPEDTSTTRPVASTPFPKKVLIFSPHPDDDVISMGGTFIRLAHQGHEVHVAYETSGDVAVHNDVVIQHMDAAYQLGFGDRRQEVKDLVASFVPGEAEPKELLAIKAAIRRSEARGAVRSFGLDDDNNAHFLNLPFYESGGVKKLPRTQVDVDIIKDLMQKIQPDQIYMAGDLADPHGTHRVCTEAALEALEAPGWSGNSAAWTWRFRSARTRWSRSATQSTITCPRRT